jgi:hypothetical protein
MLIGVVIAIGIRMARKSEWLIHPFAFNLRLHLCKKLRIYSGGIMLQPRLLQDP